MADGATTEGLTAAQASAFEVLSDHFGLKQLERLPATAVLSTCSIDGSAGWKLVLPADHVGRSRELWFVLPGSLPLDPPVVYVRPEAYREWPHVESSGKLCLWHEGEAPVGHTPADQMREVMTCASNILALIYPEFDATRAQLEFSREWPSYWMAKANRGYNSSTRILLIERPQENRVVESTRVVASSGTTFLLVGGSSELRGSWCTALSGKPDGTLHLNTLVTPLSDAPLGAPENFKDLEDLIALRAPPSARSQLATLVGQGESFGVVVYTGTELPLFAAVEIVPVPDRRPGTGYRSSRHRRYQLDQRKIASWRVSTAQIERADASWLRGRGFDTEAELLSSKHVVIVGCGSLGGLVARALAAGGIGRLSLVDPDYLSAANLGRHVLSARYLGESKAKALAHEIVSQNPHIRVDAFSMDLADYSIPKDDKAPNLVIGTTGSWPAEHRLVALHTSGAIGCLQLTWTERHAVAGHAVLACEQQDLRAIYDVDGVFLRAATEWKGQTYPLPGCEGSHQPGTFNRIQRVAGLAVEQAIGFLVGRATSGHRAWLGDSATLEKLGGSWTENWPPSAEAIERTLSQRLLDRTQDH